MSQDSAPFVPPHSYPSPPKNMWYEVPKEPPAPPAQAPKPVFPWEGQQPRPSRFFAPEPLVINQAQPADAQSGEHKSVYEPQADAEKSATGSAAAETQDDPQTPPTPTVKVIPPPPSDWNSFQHSNAWDEIPEISRYVDGLQKHRRVRSQGGVAAIGSPVGRGPGRRAQKPGGFKLTDFPTEVERPSLPVTPAPIARPSFWSDGEKETERSDLARALPTAQGVPNQSEWVCVHGRRWAPEDCICDLTDLIFVQKDPEEQLKKLAKLQHDALLRKLGGQAEEEDDDAAKLTRVIPKRSMPFGSEDAKSPTYVQQAPPPQSSAPVAPASLRSDQSSKSTLAGNLDVSPPSSQGSGQTSLLESPLLDPEA